MWQASFSQLFRAQRSKSAKQAIRRKGMPFGHGLFRVVSMAISSHAVTAPRDNALCPG